MRVVVIGNGIAGISAAAAAAGSDARAEVTVVGDEPHAQYSPCVLPLYLAGEIGRERVFLKASARYPRENVRVILGEAATGIDAQQRKVQMLQGFLAYDRLVMATGSKPIVFPLEGDQKEGVFAFKSLSDADTLARWGGRVAVVVGSGPVGIEVALALRSKGYRVYVVELLDWIMPRVFDERPASLMRDALERQGVAVLLRERVTGIEGEGRVQSIVTDQREIACDTVVFVAGMRPNVDLAQRAGIELGRLGGIGVNEHMQTSVPEVYACGDCVQSKDVFSGRDALYLLWHNAKQQGEIAGKNCVGNRVRYPGASSITGLGIGDIHAVSVGETSATAGTGEEVTVIEKAHPAGYSRLIVSNGVLAGVQSVGRVRNLGLFLSALWGGRRAAEMQPRAGIGNELSFAYSLRQHRLSRLMGAPGQH